MIAQFCDYTKNHKNVYFKWVHFMLCNYLNKAVYNAINSITAMLILTIFLLYIQVDVKNNWNRSQPEKKM